MDFDGEFNLVLWADEPPVSAASTELVVVGGNDVAIGGITLAITSDTDGPEASMNLVTWGPDSVVVPAAMNLAIHGQYHQAEDAVTLFLANDVLGSESDVDLFIQGDGVYDGYFPANSSMNLVLQRNPAEMLPLFLRGPGDPSVSGVNLFMAGGTFPSESVDLSIPQVVAELDQATKLFVHGF